MKEVIPVFLLIALIIQAYSYTNPALCTANTQFYDSVLLQCTNCPTSTERAKDSTYCNCSSSHAVNPYVIGFNDPSSCVSLGGSTFDKTTQVASIFNQDGSIISPAVITTCLNAYPDANNQNCLPCGPGKQYSPTLLTCICSSSTDYALNGGCYTSSVAWAPTQPISKPSDYLAEQHVSQVIHRHKWDASNTGISNLAISL